MHDTATDTLSVKLTGSQTTAERERGHVEVVRLNALEKQFGETRGIIETSNFLLLNQNKALLGRAWLSTAAKRTTTMA